MSEKFTEAMRQLNLKTDGEANRWFREHRKVGLPAVLWRMIRKFLKAYFFEGGFRAGFSGWMRAVHGSLYDLLAYAKYWELKERERGRM